MTFTGAGLGSGTGLAASTGAGLGSGAGLAALAEVGLAGSTGAGLGSGAGLAASTGAGLGAALTGAGIGCEAALAAASAGAGLAAGFGSGASLAASDEQSHFTQAFSTEIGILTGFSGGISGGSSSSASAETGADFATVPVNETGAAAAGLEVTLKAAGAAEGFVAASTGCFCSTGEGLVSRTFCLGLVSTGFSETAATLLSTEAGPGVNASLFLAFPCLPALTTLGAEQFGRLAGELPGVDAKGDSTGVRGVEEAAFGEVGEEEEADKDERFRLPGTAFGADEPGRFLESLPLGFAGPEAACGCWVEAEAGGGAA